MGEKVVVVERDVDWLSTTGPGGQVVASSSSSFKTEDVCYGTLHFQKTAMYFFPHEQSRFECISVAEF
jgi:hypothetical protein